MYLNIMSEGTVNTGFTYISVDEPGGKTEYILLYFDISKLSRIDTSTSETRESGNRSRKGIHKGPPLGQTLMRTGLFFPSTTFVSAIYHWPNGTKADHDCTVILLI